MKTRKYVIALGAATLALGAPLTSLADVTWITTDDEPGSRIVVTRDDPAKARLAPVATTSPRFGDLSPDRQFAFMGEESGWQLRPMEYRVDNGRLVHVDDPAGHMQRSADSRPLTPEQRIALERSSGS
jgi:hypothetical protein